MLLEFCGRWLFGQSAPNADERLLPIDLLIVVCKSSEIVNL